MLSISDKCRNVNPGANKSATNQAPAIKNYRKGGRPKKQPIVPLITGFPTCIEQSAYFNVPAAFMDIIAAIDNMSELKVLLYIMRHTWGFHDFNAPRRITVDEFMHGRKKIDGSRMDSGTGLSKSAVMNGLDRALKHGFIECLVDDSDLARVKHYYRLKMQDEGILGPEPPTPTDFDEVMETSTDQEPKSLVQEEIFEGYPENYDPYADTIFAQSPPAVATSPEQKIFASENTLTTTTPVVDKCSPGSKQLPRSKNRISESTLRNKEIRNAPTHEEIEKYVRYLPDPTQLPKAKQKALAFIRNMITDFSRDLGDYDHIPSNIAQATKLYCNSGMSEEKFIHALYETRETAKKATRIKHLNSSGNPNRMPYFFKCLAGVLHQQASAI